MSGAGMFLAGLFVGALAPIAWIAARAALRDETLARQFVTHYEVLVEAREHVRVGRVTTQTLGYLRAAVDALEDALKR